jgi:hypothetical protein
MTDETNNPPKSNNARVDASRGAIARKINRLPPGEHLVELRAQAVPDQMVLRIAAYSADLQAGTLINLDKIFGRSPTDDQAKRVYAAQGSFWLSLLAACGLQDDSELQDITLDELAEKISGKQAIAVINEAGYWSRIRPI